MLSTLMKRNDFKIWFLWQISSFIHSKKHRCAQQRTSSARHCIREVRSNGEDELEIRESKDDEIVLLVYGQMGLFIVCFHHSSGRIALKYGIHSSLSYDHMMALKFTTLRKTRTTLCDIIEKMKSKTKTWKKWFDEPLVMSVCNADDTLDRSSTKVDSNFLHFQLLIHGLLRCQYDQRSRNDFFELCKRRYQGNREQLFLIEEFQESYAPEQALYWYSRHTFIYEILNKALRIQDIQVLFLYRFFIQDLNSQLETLQRRQNQAPFRVYRGQYMSKAELRILKESPGQFISMNSFLSTSLDQEVSRMFVTPKLGDLRGVAVEIDVDPRSCCARKPFANISSQSHLEDEQEILFTVASIFRLVKIRQENDIVVLHMELCNENYNQDIQDLLDHMQMESDKYHECFSFGHILRSAKMYDQAEQFYSRLLNTLDGEHPLVAELWGSLGLVKKAKGEIASSYEFLRKSLEKYEEMGNHLGIARSLHNLANLHQMKGEFDQAIQGYKQALHIFQAVSVDESKSIASCLHNLGAAYSEQGRFKESVQCFIGALAIQEMMLPPMHPHIAATLNNVGNVYFLNGEYARARRYFEGVLDIFSRSLPSGHPSLATAYYNIGLYYLSVRDYRQSLTFLNSVLSICRNTLSYDHPEFHRCANTIEYVKHEGEGG